MVLVMYRCGTGDVSVWYWWYTGVVLAVYRCGTGGAPVWYWRCTGVVLVVHRCRWGTADSETEVLFFGKIHS